MNKINVAINIFAFNRPDHLKNLLNSLLINKESEYLPIFFYLDGARNNSDKLKISKIKSLINNYRDYLPNSKIIERVENIGCKDNIINGISETLNIYEAVIVLEEDLILDKYFINYMLKGLEKYANNRQVFHISGFSFIKQEEKSKSIFTRYMNCWGWATWSTRWALLNINGKELEESFTKEEIYKFNLDDSHDFFRQLIENRMGIINTWAIFWYATVFRNKGLCLTPINTLVLNKGYDGSGERIGENIDPLDLNNQKISTFPDNVAEDKKYFEKLKKYFQSKKNIIKTFMKRIIYLLPSKFHKTIIKRIILSKLFICKSFKLLCEVIKL